MKALTIHQPWAACIAHGPKRIENRSWQPPPSWTMPFELSVHASKTRVKSDESYRMERVERFWPEVRDVPLDRGAVVAVVTLVRVVRFDLSIDSPWACGPWCWLLENVRALADPVPCKGYQSLWTLPKDVEARVRRQLP